MKKWLLLLVFALLLHAGSVRAEEARYYTNNLDNYYHADPDCDRPKFVARYGRYGHDTLLFYERECFQKYEISEEAARVFGKAACPVCAGNFEPVYLGEHAPAWNGGDLEPWAYGGNVTGERNAYKSECSETYERFAKYYETHSYPDAFAGVWMNSSGGYTYAIVNPTQEVVDAFRNMFGGGAWIVPAKYSYNEMCALKDGIFFETLEDWCAAHPELDIHANMMSVDDVDNYLGIGLYGEDWDAAMPLLDAELELPLWVYFFQSSEIVAV